MSKYIFGLMFGIFVVGGSVFASWFGYTNLSFFDGTTTGKILDMTITVDTGSTGFWVDIFNPTQESKSLKLDFVSQMQTADGRTSCDMLSGKDFGDNLIWDISHFSVAAGLIERKRVDFDFPVCASGTLLGCVIQLATTETSIGSFDVVPGKVNFITFEVSPSNLCTPFSIKVFPGSRPGADFSNIGELRFYNQVSALQYSSVISTDQFGIGILEDTLPSGIYYVVYKGQSQLASYLSGVEVVEGSEISLDFTTGTVLYNIQNKSISQDDGFKYQIAGDLKNILGQYDFMINGNDIAILTASGFIDAGILVLDPKNLNGDAAINVSDVSIVGINFELTDPFLGSNLFVW